MTRSLRRSMIGSGPPGAWESDANRSLQSLPAIYTIPAGVPFAIELARGIMGRYGVSPERLPGCRVLLPTRRACRVVRDAFLRLSGGAPLLLPRLEPVGDLDVNEMAIHSSTRAVMDLPPALSPLRRQALLTRIILSQPEGLAKGPEQAVALAGALGELMDRIHTEGLDISKLAGLAGEDFAEHWQITLDFLSVLSQHWPAVLAAESAMEPAARRDALIRAMADLWCADPPQGPMIAAGLTGSVPATTYLMGIVARLPEGSVVLPGLDQDLDEESWRAVDETHPQAMLKRFLDQAGTVRAQIRLWVAPDHEGQKGLNQGGDSENTGALRRKLAGELMRPAATSGAWQTLAQDPQKAGTIEAALSGIFRHDCDTAQDEAAVIAMIFRETLEAEKTKEEIEPGHDPAPEPSGLARRTAALVTPDRVLARRVAALCRRWGISVDDSGGVPLAGTTPATFLRLSLRCALERLAPAPLLGALHHTLCSAGMEGAAIRHAVRDLDRLLLRGLRPAPGFSGLLSRLAERRSEYPEEAFALNRIEGLLNRLEPALSPLLTLAEKAGPQPFSLWLETHIRTAEMLAAQSSGQEAVPESRSGAERLWAGEEGEAASQFFSELYENAEGFPPVNGEAYGGILETLMGPVTVRSLWGTHPRLSILGQIEARMVQADVMILGGLNEGVWPADPGHDPWMSRPMRSAFGLPSPEQSIGMAAHDFVQGFCSPEVHLTRSIRVDGAPATPARWLQRLDVVVQALGRDPAILRTKRFLSHAKLMDRPSAVRPVTRPDPRPPVEKRPRRISVTKVDTLLCDPYAIYARSILRLYPLDPIDKEPDEADRGMILHAVLDRFVREFPQQIPEEALNRFMTLAREEMARRAADPVVWALWGRRMERIARAFINQERIRRPQTEPVATELRGESIFQILDRPVTLSAVADRVDRSRNGVLTLIDYKSGGAWSAGKIRSGALSQLPLEAFIVHRGGFPGLSGEVHELAYWKLTGREDAPMEIISVQSGEAESVQDLAAQAGKGFEMLMAAFMDPQTPYYSLPRLDRVPRYNDYEHLARVREWAAPGESEEAA